MNANFYEADLLEKYRQSISKRYKGYNRVIQLNVGKLVNQREGDDKIQDKKQSKQCTSPCLQPGKGSFSESSSRQPSILSCIVIRSTNAQFNFKEMSSQTELNKRKFMKTKFLKHSNVGEKQPYVKQENTERLIKNTVEEFLDNKFKFKKKFARDLVRLGLPEESQIILRNQLIMRLEPFSPIIRGEKKNTHAPHLKKSKTEYESAIAKDDQSKRERRNATQTKHNKQTQKVQKLKRTGSSLARKSGTQTLIESYSGTSPVQNSAPKLVKKLSSSYHQSREFFQSQQSQKLSFPKINCVNKQASKSIQVGFNPKSELQKNKQRFKKTPLLIRYPFDVKNVDSESFVCMQAESETILYGQRFNSAFEIASLTKIMTFWVVMRLVEEFGVDVKEEKVEIEYECTTVGGTSAELNAGEIYTLEGLLYGLMLPSGNDAALALAVWGGRFHSSNPQDINACISQFVMMMNKQSKQLNLIDTRFGNPHGLPHKFARSTALDVAKLCIHCMKNGLFRQVVSTKTYKCVVGAKQGRKRFNVWENTNKLLRREGFVGIKTGITITAGPCLASAYRFQQRTYVCVILRAKKISRRFKQTRKIIHWCLQKLYKDSLSPEDMLRLKSLKKNNSQLDSDYSEDESIFRYDVNNSKQFRKRCDIISEM